MPAFDFCIPQHPTDITPFLFDFPSPNGDTYTLFKLQGNEYTIVVPNLDFNFGTKYTFGSFPEYPLRAGYDIEWQSVFNTFGSGQYRFAVQTVNAQGIVTYVQSNPFNLSPDKSNTILLNWNSNGFYQNFLWEDNNLISFVKEYDIERMNWFDSIRYYGRIIQKPFDSNIRDTVYANYFNDTTLREDVRKFTIFIDTISNEHLNRLLQYGFKSGVVVAEDNNEARAFDYRDIEILYTSVKWEKQVREKYLIGVEIEVEAMKKLGYREECYNC